MLKEERKKKGQMKGGRRKDNKKMIEFDHVERKKEEKRADEGR